MLFPNHIRAPFWPHPDFVLPPSIDIEPPANAEFLFRRLCIIGIRDCQLATEDQVRCKARVLVRRVVSISVWLV